MDFTSRSLAIQEISIYNCVDLHQLVGVSFALWLTSLAKLSQNRLNVVSTTKVDISPRRRRTFLIPHLKRKTYPPYFLRGYYERFFRQVSLQSMLTGSAAGSFADDIMKWQKRLQTIESVLSVWLEVQEKWIELEDVS